MPKIKSLRRIVKMHNCAPAAVIQNKITAAGQAEDNLFKLAVGMFSADGIIRCSPNVINPLNGKGEIRSCFQSDQIPPEITVYFEIK